LGVTGFALVLTPVFYVVIRRLVEGRELKQSSVAADLPGATSAEA